MDLEAVLRTLVESEVEFILVGGGAATVHGSVRLTNDVDVVYRRTMENLGRVVKALQPLEPYLRGAPRGLPFRFDVETLRRGLNFTLTTKIADVDLLGEITGGGGFDDLRPHTIAITVFGLPILCLDLEKLIEVKRAAGRPKDLETIAELELLHALRPKS